jgi:ATP-dependent DNA helicase
LSELWSLLNFILPDIFDDLDAFQQWFNLGDMDAGTTNEGLLNKSTVVTSLHAILKPFLLRRLKVDVEKDLPPKKEYLLYAPLTRQQKDIYQAIVNRQIRQYLVDKKSGVTGNQTEAAIDEEEDAAEGSSDARRGRKIARVDYRVEENDSKYLRDLEDGVGKEEKQSGKSMEQVGQEWALKQASECHHRWS